jgi:hypothetical protein
MYNEGADTPASDSDLSWRDRSSAYTSGVFEPVLAGSETVSVAAIDRAGRFIPRLTAMTSTCATCL